eukprot:g3166.t1
MAALAAAPGNDAQGGDKEEKMPWSGIAEAEFVSDPQEFLHSTLKGNVDEKGVDEILKVMKRLETEYQQSEAQMRKDALQLESDIKALHKSLKALQKLKDYKAEGETFTTDFPLADNVYAKAHVDPSAKPVVCLWTGANVMVEYSHDEAEVVLKDQLAKKEKKHADMEATIGFIHKQTITTQVNIARVYNESVVMKRKMAAAK